MRRVLQARRGDAGRQAERRVVGDAECSLVILDANDGGDRSEDFLAADAHLVGGFGKQRRLQIEARIVAGDRLAAEGKLGAFFLPISI